MKKLLLLNLLLLFCWSSNGQNFYDNYSDYFSSISNRVKKAYSIDYFNNNKDSLDILSKIEGLFIDVDNQVDLDSLIIEVSIIENLKYLKIKSKTSFFGKRKYKTPKFPTNFEKLKALEMLDISFYKEWNVDSLFLELSKIKQLKMLALNRLPNDALLSKNFALLSQLSNIYCQMGYNPQFPDFIKDFTQLEVFVLRSGTRDGNSNAIEQLAKAPNLKDLIIWGDLNDNSLKQFSELKQLRRLKLTGTDLKNKNLFFNTITSTNLEELHLINNKLDTIPEVISGLTELHSFNSSSNKFDELPESFFELKNLKSISIYNAKLKVLSNSINKFSNLETLSLSQNDIEKLPEDWSGLHLHQNLIKKLPKGIGALKRLEKLSLSTNELTSLPNSITNLSNLTSLQLSENYLEELPEDIGNLNKLEYIGLANNNLVRLPESFSKINRLTKLDVSDNELISIPKNLGDISGLTYLRGGNNYISEIPNSISKLKKLETIILSNNSINKLPKSIGELQSLKKLILSNEKPRKYSTRKNHRIKGGYTFDTLNKKIGGKNKIVNLPRTFKKLSNLQELNFNGNISLNFHSLFKPLSKSNSSNYRLNVRHCEIDELPKVGWSSFKAKSLDIRNNKITKLPLDFINVPKLSVFYISKSSDSDLFSFTTKEGFDVLLASQGFIKSESLPETKEMAKAYAKVANRIFYRKKYKKAIEYMEKAIAIDSNSLHKNFSEDNIIKSYYETKNYKRTIELANIKIQKDTSQGGMRVINFIFPNFDYKVKSHLKLGDTIVAINALSAFSKEFRSYNQWTKAGMLSRQIGDITSSKKYFEESFNQYEKNIEFKPKSWGDHLSLLEAYVIAEEYDKANEYIKKLNDSMIFEDINYDTLLAYFEIIMDNVIGDNTQSYDEEFTKLDKRIINESVSLKRWSFELFLDWNAINTLTKVQKERIRNLSNLFM